VKRFHIRYEDDYFAEVGRPYSFGLLIDEFKFVTNAQETDMVEKLI